MTLDRTSGGQKFQDQKHYTDWTPQRFKHIIKLREKAFKVARDSSADYLFVSFIHLYN